jgi:SAM-dependent methyltransferase
VDSTQHTENEQSALWNGTAGRAWVDAQQALDRLFAPFEVLLVNAVAEASARTVLDVGCGTGSTTLAVARSLGGNGRAVGIDISEPMLELARVRAEREHVSANFIRADAEHYAFEPAVFDAIISRFGVMFFQRPVAAFANLRRAARPGATLRLIAWRDPADNPFMTTAERAAASLLPNLPPRTPDAPGQFAFANRDRIHAILQDSGWRDVEIPPLDVDCMMPTTDLAQYVTRLGPVGQALQDTDEKTRSRIVDAILSAFDAYVHDGIVRFTAACWMIGARA